MTVAMLAGTSPTGSLHDRHGEPSRVSLRQATRDLLRREASILLALWLALAMPIACHHGPMSLFDSELHARSSSPPAPGEPALALPGHHHLANPALDSGAPGPVPSDGAVSQCYLAPGHLVQSSQAVAALALGDLFQGVFSAPALLALFALSLFPAVRTVVLPPLRSLIPPDPPPRLLNALG